MSVLNSFSMKNIFYGKMDLPLFIFMWPYQQISISADFTADGCFLSKTASDRNMLNTYNYQRQCKCIGVIICHNLESETQMARTF